MRLVSFQFGFSCEMNEFEGYEHSAWEQPETAATSLSVSDPW